VEMLTFAKMKGLDTKRCIAHYQSGGYFASEYPIQRGYGFFSALRRFAIPLLKTTGQYLGKRLLATGQDVLQDVSDGKPFKQAARERFRESASAIKDDVVRKLRGGRLNKRKKRKKKGQNKARKRKCQDVFS